MLPERKKRLRSVLAQLSALHKLASDIYAEIPTEGSPASAEEAESTQICAENHLQDSYNCHAESEDLATIEGSPSA